MAAKLRRLFALYRLYARMDLQWFLQDTACCLIIIASELLSNIASISGIFLLAANFKGVGGLSADEVLLMLGFYTLADGLTYILFGGSNVTYISRRVGRGQLEHMLIQPEPLWMQLLAEGFLPVSGNSGFLCGLCLMIAAIIRLRLEITVGWLLLLLLYLLARMIILLSASYGIGAAAFYRPAACEEISSLAIDTMQKLGKYPLSGLPEWMSGLLVTALPAGLMAWFPSLALLGRIDAPLALALPIAVAAVMLPLATYAFRKGMRYYVEKGINRYRSLGYRS